MWLDAYSTYDWDSDIIQLKLLLSLVLCLVLPNKVKVSIVLYQNPSHK